jgi:hypothetical protein
MKTAMCVATWIVDPPPGRRWLDGADKVGRHQPAATLLTTTTVSAAAGPLATSAQRSLATRTRTLATTAQRPLATRTRSTIVDVVGAVVGPLFRLPVSGN